MLLKSCLSISCLLPIAGYADNNHLFNEMPMHHSDAVLSTTHRYIDFINRLGRGENFPQMEEAATLLSSDCKKILNGKLFTESREAFVNDLLSVFENQGPWQIYPAEIIPAASNHTVILRLFIEMENCGTYTTIVIVRFNPDHLITEINEVLNEVKGAYDFRGPR